MSSSLKLISDVVQLGAGRYPERIALQALTGPPGLTYGSLWDRVQRSAGALRGIGLMPGDRVLLAMDGCPEWAVAFFSILQADLVAVPIPGGMGSGTVAAVAFHAETRVCILDAQSPVAASLPHVRCLTPHELLATHDEPVTAPHASGHEIAMLVFTSGSTARPRAVELTHDNLLANLQSLVAVRQGEPDDALLSMLPPAHVFELVVGLLGPLAVGARVVYAGVLLPNRLIEALRKHRITRALVVPALLEALCREVLDGLIERGIVEAACRDLPAAEMAKKLRQLDDDQKGRIRRAVRDRIGAFFHTVGIGGAAMSPAWSEVLASVGIAVDVGYGLTEAGPLVSMGLASDCPAGSVGRPLPGVEVRLDEHGEILVRGGGVMRGYFRNGEASAAALDRGWLRTGDSGRLDEQGFLFVTGRIKEAMVTAAGETLYPDEVEPYYACPLFAEHCVVPARGPDGNDVPTLVVIPASQDATDEEIERAFAQLRTAAPARYRVAAIVRRADPLPRTALGKLRRRAVADLLSAERGTRDGR